MRRGCRCLLTGTSSSRRDGARAAGPGTVAGPGQPALAVPAPHARASAPDSGKAASGPASARGPSGTGTGIGTGTGTRTRAGPGAPRGGARAGPAGGPCQPMAGGVERYITAGGFHWLRLALATPRDGHTLGAAPGSGSGGGTEPCPLTETQRLTGEMLRGTGAGGAQPCRKGPQGPGAGASVCPGIERANLVQAGAARDGTEPPPGAVTRSRARCSREGMLPL